MKNHWFQEFFYFGHKICVFHGFRSRIPREGGHPVHVIPVT